jgi:F0F1-type ATP synthase assembly protein I
MGDSPEAAELLREIRDLQREQLAEYKKVTARSLELQEAAVQRQQQAARLYRKVVLVAGLMIGALLGLLLYLMVSFRHQLFR